MSVIFQIFLIFAAAKAAGELFVRLRQPAIVGELLVGIVLGPHALGWIHIDQASTTLALLGIVVLLFMAGLEMRLPEVATVGWASIGASLGGMIVAAATGFAVVLAFGFAGDAASLSAVALAATSVGIGARALSDLGLLGSRATRVILGAAVLDDIVVLVALPLVQGVTPGHPWAAIAIGVVAAIGFIVLVATVGTRLARRHGHLITRPRTHRAPFVLALGLCLGLAAVAESVGLAALVGAFLAGLVMAETPERENLERRMEPLFDFLVPFFFVISAAQLDVHSLGGAALGLAAVLALVTVVAKLVGAAAGAWKFPFRERLVVGAGMVPRGEVTIAVAAAGLASGSLPRSVYSALLVAVLVSALVGPVLLRVVAGRGDQASGERAELPPEGFDVDEGGPEAG